MAPAVRAPSAAQTTVIVGGSEGKCADLAGPGRRTLFVPSDEQVKDKPVANLIANPNLISSAFNVKEQRSQELMDICFKTLDLSAKNRQLQKDLNELREQTRKFVESVKANPRAPEVRTRASLASLPTGLSTVPLEPPSVQQPATFLSPMLLNLAYMSPTLYNPFLLKSLGVSNQQISSGINQARTVGQVPNDSAAATENKPKDNCCSTINCYSNNNNNNSNKAQSPLCSCCTEDQAEGNKAFYAQLNGMAQSWTNSLMIRGRTRTAETNKSSIAKSSCENLQGQKRPSAFAIFTGAGNNKRFKSSTTHSLLGSIMSPSNDDASSSSSNSCTSSPMSPFGRSSSPLFGSSKDPFIRGMDSGDDGDDDFSRQNLFQSSEDEDGQQQQEEEES